MGPYKPLRTWVDELTIPYGKFMGVDRPDRTFSSKFQGFPESSSLAWTPQNHLDPPGDWKRWNENDSTHGKTI